MRMEKDNESDLNLNDTATAIGRKRSKGGYTFPVRGIEPGVWMKFRLKCVGLNTSANAQMLELIHAWVKTDGKEVSADGKEEGKGKGKGKGAGAGAGKGASAGAGTNRKPRLKPLDIS
jgi:hypothetical protein